jgi:hypothetical protein
VGRRPVTSKVIIICPEDNKHVVRVRHRVRGDTVLETRIAPGQEKALHVDYETRLVVDEIGEAIGWPS